MAAVSAAAAVASWAWVAHWRAPRAVEPVPQHVFPVRAPAKIRRVRPATDPELEAKLAKLRGSDSIAGPHVGIAGLESHVHRIGAQIIQSGDLTLFHWLAEDDDPALRALGLWGAATAGDLSTLTKHYCDRERIEACPGGCICWKATVGYVAQTFAMDPAWLGDGRAPSLLTPAEHLKLAVQTTAIDGCQAASGGRAQAPEGTEWTWAELHSRMPSLPAWMVVKAMARKRFHQPTSDLIEVLRNDALPAQARLAAASGLTRHGGTGAAEAIEDAEGFLEDEQEGLFARLREELSLRTQAQALDEKLSGLAAAKTQALADDMLRLYRHAHPLIMDLPRATFGDRTEQIARARGQYLVSLSRNLSAYRECWNTYRDTAYELESLLNDSRAWQFRTSLLPEERTEILSKAQEEIALLDAQLACRSY